MKPFLERIKAKAKEAPKTLVFAEGFDERVLEALPEILEENTAKPIVLGDPKQLHQKAKDLCFKVDWDRFPVIDTKTDPRVEEFAEEYCEIRDRAITQEKAIEAMKKDFNLFGTMLVHRGVADGMISGATCSTAATIRPALQIIKTKERFHKVSGFFFMVWDERVLLFADCAVIPEPNSYELAGIAIDSAETAKRFGINPKIAMLSFSTNGSADHPNADKVREATKMVRHQRPDLVVEGEMQVDAALVPDICRKKFPAAVSFGDYNVLIFPSLEAGNIAYKLVERLAGAEALGPIYQGLNKPVNDLSRGCSSQDIIDLAAITTVEAQGKEKMIE